MKDTSRLRPREHGAYAMLAFPILSGLALGGFSLPGTAAAALAVAGFLAHESLTLILGGRGERLRSASETAARRRLLALGVLAVLLGAVFAFTAPAPAWGAAAVCGLLAAAVGALLLAGRTRSLGGELAVAAAFASVHGVVASSGGADLEATAVPVMVWAASFALATLAVHSMKYRFKGRGPGRWAVVAAPGAAAVAALAALAGAASVYPWGGGASALLPKVAVVLTLALLTVHPRQLKRVGWTLVAADTLTLVFLGIFLR